MNLYEATVILGLLLLLVLLFVGLMIALMNRTRPNPYYNGYGMYPQDVYQTSRMPPRMRQPPDDQEDRDGCLAILIYTGVAFSFFVGVGFLAFLSRLLNGIG